LLLSDRPQWAAVSAVRGPAAVGQEQTVIREKIYMTDSLATYSQYFRIGIEAGICTPDAAREWAMSVIARMDEPPGEIIEVSWRKPLPQLIDDLNSVRGEVDLGLAGNWLLCMLLRSISATDANIWRALTAAKQIVFCTGTSAKNTELYTILSSLEDELNLAESGVFGTVEACKADIKRVIAQHSSLPPDALFN